MGAFRGFTGDIKFLTHLPHCFIQLGGIVTPNDGKCHLKDNGNYMFYSESNELVRTFNDDNYTVQIHIAVLCAAGM